MTGWLPQCRYSMRLIHRVIAFPPCYLLQDVLSTCVEGLVIYTVSSGFQILL